MNTEYLFLITSRQGRLATLFKLLDTRQHEFTDFYCNRLYKMPKVSNIRNKDYWRSKVKLPISYETTTRYRIRLNNIIYEVYKNNNNYYFIDIPGYIDPNDPSIISDFVSKIQFSFILYLVITLLLEITSKGEVEVQDHIFSEYTDRFSTKGAQLKLILTLFPIEDKIFDNNHLYISLFNK